MTRRSTPSPSPSPPQRGRGDQTSGPVVAAITGNLPPPRAQTPRPVISAPQWPAGPFAPGAASRAELVADIVAAPAALRAAVAGLTDAQLDTPYRNWTVRQIVHHLADSHVNCYVRFKLALTEDVPTIKPYDETRWSALPDARGGDVAPPLALYDAAHARWAQLMGTMTDADFARAFFHPEVGGTVRLDAALAQYAWHGRHHTAQVRWVRETHGW